MTTSNKHTTINKRKLCLAPKIYEKTLAKPPFSQLPTRKTPKSTGAQLRFSSAQHTSQGPPLHQGFERLERRESCGLRSAWVSAEAGSEKARRDVPGLVAHRSLAPWRGTGGCWSPPGSHQPAPREVIPRCLMSASSANSRALRKVGVQRVGLWNVMKIRPSYREANPALKITKHQQSAWLSV